MSRKDEVTRVAFVGFGEVNTPRELIETRCDAVAKQLEEAGLSLVKAGLVADDPAGKQADGAVEALSGQEFSAVVVCVAGWIPSWAVFSVIEPFKHKPIVLLGLTGWQDGECFVTTADQAGTTALRKPMADMGYTFKYVVTRRGAAVPIDAVVSYCRAADTVRQLKSAKIGINKFETNISGMVTHTWPSSAVSRPTTERPKAWILASVCAATGINSSPEAVN